MPPTVFGGSSITKKNFVSIDDSIIKKLANDVTEEGTDLKDVPTYRGGVIKNRKM